MENRYVVTVPAPGGLPLEEAVRRAVRYVGEAKSTSAVILADPRRGAADFAAALLGPEPVKTEYQVGEASFVEVLSAQRTFVKALLRSPVIAVAASPAFLQDLELLFIDLKERFGVRRAREGFLFVVAGDIAGAREWLGGWQAAEWTGLPFSPREEEHEPLPLR